MSHRVMFVIGVLLLGTTGAIASSIQPKSEIDEYEIDEAVPALSVKPDFFEGLFLGTSKPEDATVDPMQAQGFYAQGSLENPSQFPDEGDGLLKIIRPRNRRFATQDYVDIISNAASAIHALFPDGERLQLGDIAQAQGGYISGHDSHQNGLDGDIVYYRNNHFEQDPNDGTGMNELFVVNGEISPNFDAQRSWLLINQIYDTGRLVRIFMDQVIKNAFCTYAQNNGFFDAKGIDVLRHMRPLVGHQNHMHIRILCPDGDTACTPQFDVPPGSGCPGSTQ